MPDSAAVYLVADPITAAVDGMGDLIDTHMHVLIDPAGRIDPEHLRCALDALAIEIPTLGAHFERRWWRSRWVKQSPPAWSIIEHHDVSPTQAEGHAEGLFAEPFEPHATLPVKLVLLHLPDHDRLLLRVNHLLADGGGTKNLCYRLARCYRRVGSEPDWTPEPAPRPHPLRRLIASFSLAHLPAMLRDALTELAANRSLRPIHVPMGPPGPGDAHAISLHLSAERVARLRAGGKRRGATLNDLALAAFSRAIVFTFPAANAERSHAALIATADLRKLQPDLMDVCNYSSIRPLILRRLPLPDIEGTVSAVVATTRAWKAGRVGVLLGSCAIAMTSVLPHAWTRAMVGLFLRRLMTPSGACAGLTNIGPIDASALDFGEGPALAASVTTPLAHAPAMITALTGCAGALDFTMAFTEPQLARDDAQRLVEAMDRELASLE